MARPKRPNYRNQRRDAEGGRRWLRREVIKGVGAASVLAGTGPHLWFPNAAFAQTAGRDSVKHVLYVQLDGGFRFTAAFNGDVAGQFNPYGLARNVPEGVQWGPSRLLESATWLSDEDGPARRQLGMRSVVELSNKIAVVATVDHEPFSGCPDGNHGSGLERYLTGYAGGATSVFTYLNYAMRSRVATGSNTMSDALPAFVLGRAGMALGAGKFAAFRPPVIEGTNFSRFKFSAAASLPPWSLAMSRSIDVRKRDRQNVQLRPAIDAYIQTRDANERFNAIFSDPILDIDNTRGDAIDGLTQQQLRTLFGDEATGRSARLALRLFHFGCPAVYFSQGGYDMHSNEEERLGDAMDELNQLVSALYTALTTLQHPSGGTYWDHTLVVLGSEFGRTPGDGGGGFNSARGSDHRCDLATRWMSMPLMGGVIERAGKGGAMLGRTRSGDLQSEGKVYSYRATFRMLMDLLGGEHADIFPNDEPYNDLFV